MEKKINVAELLKDCPSGMELDCTIWDNIIFEEIDGNNIVIFRKSADAKVYLTQYGEFNSIDGKCVIFPKGKTTWEGFHRPFKDGDIVTWKENGSLVAFIYKERKNSSMVRHHFALYVGGLGTTMNEEILIKDDELRFATKEEKEKLFQAIKDNGYNWNTETKTLKKLIEPKFKVGDRIKHKDSDLYCTLEEYSKGISAYRTNIGLSLTYKELEQWELVPNKFDITTLKPFESRVLVRDSTTGIWYPEFFGCLINSNNYPYMVLGGNRWKYCVPYEGNEHLLETNNDCDDYYKTW